MEEHTLDPFVPNEEAMERDVIFADDDFTDFAFDLHVEVARRFFASR